MGRRYCAFHASNSSSTTQPASTHPGQKYPNPVTAHDPIKNMLITA